MSIGGSDFGDLLDSSKTLKVGELHLRVLTLSKIIESKELANRDKDRATLPVLRKTLQLKGDGSKEGPELPKGPEKIGSVTLLSSGLRSGRLHRSPVP